MREGEEGEEGVRHEKERRKEEWKYEALQTALYLRGYNPTKSCMKQTWDFIVIIRSIKSKNFIALIDWLKIALQFVQ